MTMTDYGYCHARIRGMKSRLFSPELFERLLGAREISELTKLLDETVYCDDIRHGLLRCPGTGGIEEGLRLNLGATFQRILGLLEGEAQRLVEVLLARWDVQNIKTVLRGKHVGAACDEIIGSLVPAGKLPEGTLVSLAKEPDIKATIDLMATWGVPFYKPLTQNFSAYVTSHSTAELELSLDKYYYKTALAQLVDKSFESALVRELVRRQIDFCNVMTVLRLVHERTGDYAERFFIEGGKEIGRDLFMGLAATESIDDVAAGLADTSFFERLSLSLDTYRSLKSLAAVERGLEDQAIKKTISLFQAEPLSLAVIIAYLWAKVNEVVNIRIILRAKEAGVPVAGIREALVLV